CAAEFILETEKFAKAIKKNLVVTIGKLQVINPASNVIPGEVICSLDIRNEEEAILSSACLEIQELAVNICQKREIGLKWNLIQQAKPVTCNTEMNQLLIQSVKEAGFELVKMVSGAGHDAVPVSEVSPVAMLFVRCFKGISHNPKEDVELKDISAAINVSDNFIQRLIQVHNS